MPRSRAVFLISRMTFGFLLPRLAGAGCSSHRLPILPVRLQCTWYPKHSTGQNVSLGLSLFGMDYKHSEQGHQFHRHGMLNRPILPMALGLPIA